MKKCDFCINQSPCGGCKYGSPTGNDCKDATEKFFKYSMLKEQNKTKNKTYTKNINVKKR